MKLHAAILRILLFVASLATFTGDACSGADREISLSPISRVAQMPNLPQPYSMRDWKQVTRDYLNLVFDCDQRGEYLPLITWTDKRHRTLSLPSYVGGPTDAEAINYLAAVVSGSLVGLDMRSFRGEDWVAVGTQFFNADEGVYVNRVRDRTGKSFWYDILPNVLAFQINSLYPGDEIRDLQAIRSAAEWHRVCEALGGKSDPLSLPNFDHTGFSLQSMQPQEKGWIEPEAAAGIAWLEYMAWVRFKDPRFLTAADWCLRTIESRPADQSPLYEVLLPYGAVAASRMNAELGRDYDVSKLVQACFDPHGRPQARPGWGVISARWSGLDAHGLVGSSTDGGGYAFAMNSFQWVGALAPLARYDTRYAHDIGKWTLNLANAARLFYPNALDATHQSSHAWSAAHDNKSVIAYEGIRKWKRGACTACADVRTTSGKIISGSFASTQFRGEKPLDRQSLQESADDGIAFEHIWEFELPAVHNRWLVVDAERVDGGHVGNVFQFSFASDPNGPYTPAFLVAGLERTQVVELPDGLTKKLYVKAQSSEGLVVGSNADQLNVDAMAVSYCDTIGPFAQGDLVVTFIDLLQEASVPIVLYRPASAATDLGLYGSSHVGILGGIIMPTNVEGILQLDLLKTDYFHASAYPSYLYYNPHSSEKSVDLDVGTAACDVYDAVSEQFIQKGVQGLVHFTIPADAAMVIVLAPTGGKLRQDGKRTLIDNVVVRWAE
jgi:hypothetical protein